MGLRIIVLFAVLAPFATACGSGADEPETTTTTLPPTTTMSVPETTTTAAPTTTTTTTLPSTTTTAVPRGEVTFEIIVVNGDGGLATNDSFAVYSGNRLIARNGRFGTAPPGTYDMEAHRTPGYEVTWGGEACEDTVGFTGRVTFTSGQSAACTLTYDDVAFDEPVPMREDVTIDFDSSGIEALYERVLATTMAVVNLYLPDEDAVVAIAVLPEDKQARKALVEDMVEASEILYSGADDGSYFYPYALALGDVTTATHADTLISFLMDETVTELLGKTTYEPGNVIVSITMLYDREVGGVTVTDELTVYGVATANGVLKLETTLYFYAWYDLLNYQLAAVDAAEDDALVG